MTSEATSHRRPQQSILSLDKGEEPFAVQIAQACSILEIDLDEHWKAFQNPINGGVLQKHDTSDPRAEWAMRWLLKKLQYSDLAPGSPHLKPRSWIILQELVVRTPLASVARLLRTHQFTSVLRKTLQWIRKRVTRVTVSPEVGIGNEDLLDPLEDSSDTVESSSGERKTSRKRKRDGREVTASEEAVSTAAGTFKVLYLAICGTVRQLESLTMDPERTQGYAVEHLKSSLRSSPEDAAHILGSSFYLANRIVQTPQRHCRQTRLFTSEIQMVLADTGYRTCVLPMIDLWNRRSLVGQHSSTSSNVAFLVCCMLPALQLLDTCRQRPAPKEKMAEMIRCLETLLVDHIVLPLRSSFLGLEPANKSEHDISLASFSDRMTSLLRGFLPQPEDSFDRADWKINKHLAISIISLLFDVAITSRPRTTAKLRRLENPWLEQLFIKLTKCAETLFPPFSAVIVQKDHSRVIKWMMRKAVDHQVHWSTSTIKALLDQVSGLFRDVSDIQNETRIDVEGDKQIEWGLVSLCILNDSNTFVVPSSSASNDQTYAYRPPNEYLSALLRNISHEMCYESSEEDVDYDFKLEHVIKPLCDAFVGARDLTGFLEHWREQLCIVQEYQRTYCSLVPSIWEDERLLLYVAQSIESSLTTGQIDRVLSAAARDLAPSIPNVLSDPVSLASLVILDCVCAGLFKDETLVKLDTVALSVFNLLGVLVSSPSDISSPHGWRVWRVMARITDRWSLLRDSPPFKRKAQSAICMASELISRISSGLNLHNTVDLTEELYAMKFMLKFAAMEDSFWEDLRFSSRRKILLAVTKLLDIMEPFCHRISHDHFGTMMRSDAVSGHEQSSLRISPLHKFYFDCIDEIIKSPSSLLSHLEEGTQKRLIQQLYWSSVFEHRFLSSESGSSINYSSCWKKLLRYDASDENGSMTKCLRTFQVDCYLNVSYFGEPKYWDVETADYVVALQGIQATPCNAFDRGQRSKLANRVLRILLLANMSKLARTADHLILLVKLIQMPNKTLNILTNETEMIKKGYEEPKSEMALISLAGGIDGVIGWSEDNVHSIKALRQLTHSVMSYLFSTLDQKSSMQYLQTYYGQMAHILENSYKNNTTCTTAFSALFEVSLNYFSRYRNDLSDVLEPVRLDTTRQYHLESILKRLDGLDGISLSQVEQRHSCGVNLECLAGYSDLLAIHPNLHDISGRLFGGDGPFHAMKALGHEPNTHNTAIVCKDWCSIEYLAVCLAKVELRLYAYDYNLHPKLAQIFELFKDLHSHSERTDLLCHFRNESSSLGSQSKKELCFKFRIDHGEHLSYSQLLRVQIGLSTLNDQETEELSVDLSQLLVLLDRGLSQPTEFSESMLSMQCINMFLRNHTRVISQWHIDELLAGITIKASNLGSRMETNSGRLYICLCRLFGTIVVVHRAKIGGRYHLVVLALQALLHCLFVPYNDSEAVGSEVSVFGEAHAAAYGRILSMICDPTVSSVTRSRNRSRLDLNDETKRARSIAGQHLPSLIMTFCGCQLTSRLLPGMRAALNTGLYAVLAVVPPDVMRTMNAAMDSSSRSVFKALYDDYRRSGKWDGS